MPEISLIIPTFNRRDLVIQNVAQLRKVFPNAEIIVIDDGSKDNTFEALQRTFQGSIICLRHLTNQGKGESLRKGFEQASGSYLVFTDDDLPYGIEAIKAVIQKLKEGYPLVIGERRQFYDNWIKKIGRKVFDNFFKKLLGIQLKDTQAGLKGFSQEAGKKLFALSITHRFAIDLEIIFLSQKLHYPLYSVPVQPLDSSPSHLSLANLFFIFLETLKIKFHHYDFSKN